MFFFVDSSEDECVDLTLERRILRDRSNPLGLKKKVFQGYYRVSKEVFCKILDEIQLDPIHKSSAVPPILKLTATLSLLATGSYQRHVGSNFLIGMSQRTVSRIFQETIYAMQQRLCSKWINFEEENFMATKIHFYEKYKLPGIIGCIDGTHVPILKPKLNEHIYLNRKGWHSLNVMIICDQNYNILAIDPGYGGANHDAGIWALSTERNFCEAHHIQSGNKSLLIGDSAYPLEPWMLTPYRAARDASTEKAFNDVLAKGRSCVERTIGVLKGRWRCLCGERKMRYSTEKMTVVVNVCAALHNICVYYNEPFNENLFFISENINVPCEENISLPLHKRAAVIRDKIKNPMFRNR